MQCERLIRQIKTWYLSVRDETMAPARMVSFIEQHAATCDTCLKDPDLKGEIAKITELILPESKIPKAVRQQNADDDDSDDDYEDSEDISNESDEEEEEETDDIDEEDIDEEFLDDDEDED